MTARVAASLPRDNSWGFFVSWPARYTSRLTWEKGEANVCLEFR